MNSKVVMLCAVFVLIFPVILAICEDGQININSASLENMMKIKWMGGTGVVAQRVIDKRPFNSLDDLTSVSGLGGTGARVEDIKTQGLACVSEEQTEQAEEIIEDEIVEKDIEKKIIEIPEIEIAKVSTKTKNEVIELVPQTIKSENYIESLSKEDYAKYGLVLFCVLLGGLFTIKKYKPRKNEFR